MRNKKRNLIIFIILLAVLSFGEGTKTNSSDKQTETVNTAKEKKKKKKENRQKETPAGNSESKNSSSSNKNPSQNTEKDTRKDTRKDTKRDTKNSKTSENENTDVRQDTEKDKTDKSSDSKEVKIINIRGEKTENEKFEHPHGQEETAADKKSEKDLNEKSKIDKKKPAVMAEEKEVEGISRYYGTVHKFIATKDGRVLKNGTENELHPTASLAKVMNIVVALDQVDKGNASLEDNVCFTPETTHLKGSWLNVKVGDCFKLKDLLKAEIIYSANNAAYLVAKHIGKGNIDNFVILMNQKARELGMTKTVFYTPAGLPTSMTGKKMDVSTAYDMYLLGKKAIEDERIKEWSSEPELVLMNSRGEQVIYKNRNLLLYRHGIYGLKTGFHADAGYNLILTSKMGNIEIISITLGNRTDEARMKDQKHEFTLIEDRLKPVYTAGNEMGKFKVTNAVKKEIKGIISDNVYQIDNSTYTFNVKDLNVNVGKEGIKKGDKIGKLEVFNSGQLQSEVDIVSNEDVEELSWFGKLLRYITFGLL